VGKDALNQIVKQALNATQTDALNTKVGKDVLNQIVKQVPKAKQTDA
jgi:hypothetical protein